MRVLKKALYHHFIKAFLRRGNFSLFLFFCILFFLWSILSFIYKPCNPPSFDENKFCMFDNVVRRTKIDYDRISLILHASFDRLQHIRNHLSNWDGPISIAIVFDERATYLDIQCATSYIRNLSKPEEVSRRLSVHYLLMGKKDCETIQNIVYFHSLDDTCEQQPIEKTNLTVDQIISYPVNIARNYAREMSKTKYILLADLEHYFSKNFENKMLNLAEEVLSQDSKMVLVYRIFEVDETFFKKKETKKGLIDLLQQNNARQFHEYFPGHIIPRLVEWVYTPELDENKTTIQFYQPYIISDWEPQFVSLSNIPLHDINFKFPLRDNTVLRWELCHADYEFAVVNNVFMYHPGFKTLETNNIFSKARNALRWENNVAIRKFKKRMSINYPDSNSQCPV